MFTKEVMYTNSTDSEGDVSCAFVELLIQHQRMLYGYIFNLIPNAADSEDLLQDTNLTLWKKRREFQPESSFMAWACQTAFFKIKNFVKIKGRSRVFFNDSLLDKISEMQLERAEINTIHSTMLVFCLEKLSASSQELLKLCYDEDHSIKDIADQLGRPIGSVYSSLSQIRLKLWKCIKRAFTEELPT
jgi:RNA polymerase sigma-70 factor, ECF subfamily